MEPKSPPCPQARTTLCGERLTKYQPDPRAPRFEITGRDLAVLQALQEFGLATRAQVQALFFPSLQTASKRLQLLFHGGYVERRVFPRAFFDFGSPQTATTAVWGTPPMVYVLTPKGRELLAACQGEEAAADQDRAPEIQSPIFLAHRLALTDLRVALLGAAQRTCGESLRTWYEGAEAQQEWTSPAGRGQILRPDALFFYGIGERMLIAFAEVDRGTERGNQIQDKLARYVDYSCTDGFFRRYGRKHYRVLFLLASRERQASLEGHLEGVTEGSEERERFWWGLQAQATAEGLRAAEWQRGDDPVRQPFLPPPDGATFP